MGFVDWPAFPADTDVGPEGKLQEQLGFFLKDSIHGFRANDFQGQVAWENAFGTCSATPERQDGCGARVGGGCAGCACEAAVCRAFPACCDVRWDERCAHFCEEAPEGCMPPPDAPDTEPSYLQKLIAEAEAMGEAGANLTVGDLVSALKDRLLTDPQITDPDEVAALERVLGLSFSTPVAQAEGLAAALPWACTTFISTPQFQMEGVALPNRRGTTTRVVVPETSFRSLCEAMAAWLPAGRLTCADDAATFAR
jgi:hypothetical protein